MYVQLIIIFIVLAIFAVLHIVTLGMLIKMKKNKPNTNNYSVPKSNTEQKVNIITPSQVNSTVTCRKCQNKFDVNYSVCPKCGTIR